MTQPGFGARVSINEISIHMFPRYKGRIGSVISCGPRSGSWNIKWDHLKIVSAWNPSLLTVHGEVKP